MMKKNFYCIVSLITMASLSACSGSSSADTHSAGKTVVYIEESFKPLFETSIDTFESLYAKADITAKYNSESNVIDMFFKNQTKTICISRDFTKEEKAQLKKNQVEVRSDKIAGDAIALIVNPENPDTLLTVDQLKRIITGKDTIWTGLRTKINVVFDNENSANFHYLKELCAIGNLPINVFAVKSNEEVINYVKTHKSALGVIGVNWVSDRDDFEVLDFLNGIKVVAVAKTEKDKYFKPYQGFIYTKEYALTRDVWMINKAKKSGLNTGLVLFMIGENGQLLIQKCGLVPANSPVRLIQMSTEK